MKCVFAIMTLLSLVLSSCTTVTKGFQENTLREPIATEGVTKIPIRVIGGDEKSLREFIAHSRLPAHPDDAVYIGSKPKDLPYDLPMPDDARIIGCVKGQLMDYTLLFETDFTPELTQKFYAESLIDKGWHKVPQHSDQPRGFISQPQPDLPSYDKYCFEKNSAFLSLQTSLISDKKTSIRLSLMVDPEIYMCVSDSSSECSNPNNLIPRLHSPNDTIVHNWGIGSSNTEANAKARLIIKMPVAEIGEHYNRQLISSKWKLQNSDHGEGAAWSNWKFIDEKENDWMGTLVVIQTSKEKNTFHAILNIERM